MLFPGLALLFTALAFNFVGDALTDALEPAGKKTLTRGGSAVKVRRNERKQYAVQVQIARGVRPRAAGSGFARCRGLRLEQ